MADGPPGDHRGHRRGETAIGYRRNVDIYAPPAYGVVLNPDKAAPLALDPADRVIVLAEY